MIKIELRAIQYALQVIVKYKQRLDKNSETLQILDASKIANMYTYISKTLKKIENESL